MRMPTILSAVLLALVCGASLATAESEVVLAHEKYQLPNGLTVILHENHKLPQVVVNIWYHCGTREEPPGRSGFAHLFEHLMFMGTERVPDSQFDVLMESGGGSNNASTWFDRTNYYDWGPAKILPTLLWLEADRMTGLSASMTQEKLDLQRDVVRNERREGYDNAPYGPANYLFWQLMFPSDHPYHFHVIGSHEDLVAATVQDVVGFYDTYYVPNNATLVVAGAFDSKQVKPLIQGLFGSIPRGKEPPRRSAPPAAFERVERVTLTDKVQLPLVTMAWHTPAYYRDGDAEMDLLAFALGTGKNGRLHKRLVRDEQIAVDVSVGQTSLRLGSVFRVDCYAKPDADLDRIEAIIDEELARLSREGPTERELLRARAELETGTWSQLESLQDTADQLNQYDAFLGRPDAVAWDLARYARATPASVRDWAQRALRLDRRLVLRVVPEVAPEAALPTLDKRPPDLPEATFRPPLPETFQLPNGLTVWHVQRTGIPLVAARLLLPGGALVVPREQAGVADLAAHMLLEGAGDLDALQFADALDVLGASLGAEAGSEGTVVSLRTLRRGVGPAFALLAKALTAARFDGPSFARQKSLHLDGLRQLLDEPTDLARRTANEAYFASASAPAHAVPVAGYPATIQKLTAAQAKAHHDRWHTPRGAILLTAGDLTAAEMRAVVEEHLAGWTSEHTRPPTEAPTPPKAGSLRVYVVERPGAAQTVVRFLYPGIAFQAQQRVPVQVLNTLFGGNFTSRLNANLREKHGYTYGASSGFATMDGHGLFMASANVETDKTGAALHEFFAEFERIRAGGVTDVEALKARETVRAGIIQRFESIDGILGSYLPYARYGVPAEALAGAFAQAAACEPATLDALAKEEIARAGGVLVLVGDRAAIDAQIGELGLGSPVYLSADDALEGRLAR